MIEVKKLKYTGVLVASNNNTSLAPIENFQSSQLSSAPQPLVFSNATQPSPRSHINPNNTSSITSRTKADRVSLPVLSSSSSSSSSLIS